MYVTQTDKVSLSIVGKYFIYRLSLKQNSLPNWFRADLLTAGTWSGFSQKRAYIVKNKRNWRVLLAVTKISSLMPEAEFSFSYAALSECSLSNSN